MRARIIWAIAFFTLVAIANSFPLILHPGTSIGQHGDSYFSVWRLAWVAHQLRADPWHLFDSNNFHPNRDTLAYSDAMLLPAHGPVTESAHARVDALLAHHDGRLDETERAVRGGATTVFEAASALRWTRREHRVADLDPFNAMLAVFETGAHLDLLVAQGRLALRRESGLKTYS